MAVIDVGAAVIDRGSYSAVTATRIEGSNAANDTGTIAKVEMWFKLPAGENVEVATFIHEGSNVFSTRDSEAIGDVPVGSKQTFTGLDMDVATGDYIGIYGTAGYIERDSSGGVGYWYTAGDQISCTSVTFTWSADNIMSLYGEGETEAPPEANIPAIMAHYRRMREN